MEDGRGSSGIGSDKSIGLAEGIRLPAEAVESNRSRPKQARNGTRHRARGQYLEAFVRLTNSLGPR